jgi:Ni/Co efflux regulator RcnB
MKPSRLATLALVSLLSAAVLPLPAMARDHDRGNHRGHNDRGHDRGRHDDRRSSWNDRDGHRYDDRGRDRRPVVVYRPAPRPVVVHEYRAPPPYGWARGQRYRDRYSGPVYVVNDYPRYHLRQPPHGYHWIRDDRGNMLMVAVATGIIADLLLHH